MRSSIFSKKIDHDQNLLLLKDKPIKPTMTFLSSFPMNLSLLLLLASLPPDKDSWHIFLPRPKKTNKLAFILEEIIRTMYYSEINSQLPDKFTIQPPLLVIPQSPHFLQQNPNATLVNTRENKCHKPPLQLSSYSLFLFFFYSINSIGKFVTQCDRKRDRVTSMVTSQDMSHIVWLGVWNTKCTDQVDYV